MTEATPTPINALEAAIGRIENAFMELAAGNNRRQRQLERIEERLAAVEQYKPPVYVAHTAGCVCPVGAQISCGNPTCPRLGVNVGPTYRTGLGR